MKKKRQAYPRPAARLHIMKKNPSKKEAGKMKKPASE